MIIRNALVIIGILVLTLCVVLAETDFFGELKEEEEEKNESNSNN